MAVTLFRTPQNPVLRSLLVMRRQAPEEAGVEVRQPEGVVGVADGVTAGAGVLAEYFVGGGGDLG